MIERHPVATAALVVLAAEVVTAALVVVAWNVWQYRRDRRRA